MAPAVDDACHEGVGRQPARGHDGAQARAARLAPYRLQALPSPSPNRRVRVRVRVRVRGKGRGGVGDRGRVKVKGFLTLTLTLTRTRTRTLTLPLTLTLSAAIRAQVAASLYQGALRLAPHEASGYTNLALLERGGRG